MWACCLSIPVPKASPIPPSLGGSEHFQNKENLVPSQVHKLAPLYPRPLSAMPQGKEMEPRNGGGPDYTAHPPGVWPRLFRSRPASSPRHWLPGSFVHESSCHRLSSVRYTQSGELWVRKMVPTHQAPVYPSQKSLARGFSVHNKQLVLTCSC